MLLTSPSLTFTPASCASFGCYSAPPITLSLFFYCFLMSLHTCSNIIWLFCDLFFVYISCASFLHSVHELFIAFAWIFLLGDRNYLRFYLSSLSPAITSDRVLTTWFPVGFLEITLITPFVCPFSNWQADNTQYAVVFPLRSEFCVDEALLSQ